MSKNSAAMRHRPSKLICRIDVSGFVAVMLFFFIMLALPYSILVHPKNVYVDLPKAAHSVSLPGAGREDALVISVFRDGQFFFETQRVSLDELAIKLRQRIKDHAPRTAYINADARCKYLAVQGVLESVRAAGIEKVAFLTGRRVVQ
jgi:biopolymer transport protein ExbD